MKLSQIFIFNTIAALSYALGFLIIPETITSWHGITADQYTILMARYFGVALLGIGLLTWLVRDAPDTKYRDGILTGLGLSYIAGFVLSLQSTMAGQMNVLGWLPVVVYLLLVLGFGYFRFLK